MTLIDLDEEPVAERTPPAGRVRTIFAAVALLSAGAALGGLGRPWYGSPTKPVTPAVSRSP
ncbi:hypothetical protein ACQP2E_28325 [Actinoplanes sp. CA-015351]|uniref:hypothetical protein n=1 Tax=Actinoplanes sp. CA-015351 TaxID=3239897 RepID=UPI003D9630D8